MQTDKLFTGQRDTGLGIYYFNARFYSPKLGRFLSADTVVSSYANPQDLNRFSYVLNNPLRYIDPTGHNWEDCGNRSGYRCRIHMNHVGRARARWAAEAAAQQQHAAQQAATLAAQNFAAQQAATQFAHQEFMNSSSGVMGNNGISSSSNILDRNRDDDATLPTPTLTPSTAAQPSSRTLISRVAQFGFGAALIAGGLISTGLGAGMIIYSAIEGAEAVAAVEAPPLSVLILLKAGAAIGGGIFFSGLGLAAIGAGSYEINQALTP